jgi:UDP:flavonoid glycosyltransferase YjiC (YdhE family)
LLSSTAHPNVKLLVKHDGLLSIHEAIHRGVPVVGTPILGDQKDNVNTDVSLGFGVKLDFANISTESVTWALKEGLENPG